MKSGKIDIVNQSPEEVEIAFDLKKNILKDGDEIAHRESHNFKKSRLVTPKGEITCEYGEFSPVINHVQESKVLIQAYNSYDLLASTNDIKEFIDEKLIDQDSKTVMSVLAALAAKAGKSNYGSMMFPNVILFAKGQGKDEDYFELHPNMCLDPMQFQSQIIDLGNKYADKKIEELFEEYDFMIMKVPPFTRLHFNKIQ